MVASFRVVGLCLLLSLAPAFSAASGPESSAPVVTLPSTSLVARDLAVVINESDPLSVAIGEYYQSRRGIPAENVVRVRFDATRASLGAQEFARVRAEVASRTPAHAQAYALTWARPYRVDCMSITTAFAAGYQPAFCSERCTATRWSPYFNSNSRRPFRDFGLRPTMSLAALDFERARELIDRGVAADGSMQKGKAYLVSTTDLARNVRSKTYPDAELMVGDQVPIERLTTAALEGKQDVMFYFIGASEVGKLPTNRFLPGAVGDHLTSLGGDLTGVMQMSSLRWLEAGATGSYGAVTEPCNILGKFPNPGMMMKRYLAGETLIEAYWKSVAMPGQGLFIGEPLANPYGGYSVMYDGRDLAIQATGLPVGYYSISGSQEPSGPYRTVAGRVHIAKRGATIRLRNADLRFYRVTRAD